MTDTIYVVDNKVFNKISDVEIYRELHAPKQLIKPYVSRLVINEMEEMFKQLQAEADKLVDALISIAQEPWSMSDDPSLRSGHIAAQAINRYEQFKEQK